MIDRLSDREREVMAYVAAHYRSKAIARQLGTAPKTVDAQIASACKKLGADNRDDAVRMLLKAGVIFEIGENPAQASTPIAGRPHSLFHPPGHNGRAYGTSNSEFAAPKYRRAIADDDLSRSGASASLHRGGRSASEDDPVFGFGFAAPSPLSDGAAGDVRNHPIGELPGGHWFTSSVGWVGLHPGVSRVLFAFGISIALAVAVPLGLYGAVALQHLVQALQSS